MLRLKTLFFIGLLFIAFSSFVIAQPSSSIASNNPSNSGNNQNKEPFVFLDGGFSIDLSRYLYNRKGIEPNKGFYSGGNQFVWQIPEGVFTVSYIEYTYTPENGKEFLQTLSDNLALKYTSDGGKALNQTWIYLSDNPGVEIKTQVKSGDIKITRYYLAKNWLYIITGGWKADENGATQLKILDSFKLVDSKAYIAKKVEEATPKALPQSPVSQKLKSDAEDDGLKGKVKLLIEGEEYLSADSTVIGTKISFEDQYNESGNRIKQILYDYRGNPDSITVFGYIDRMRVSQSGSIDDYEYSPPMAIGAKSTIQNTPENKPVEDSRYKIRYEYKYENNRLKEVTTFSNTGLLNNRSPYSYDGSKIIMESFDRNGKQVFKSIEIYDDKRNLIERTYVSLDSKAPDSIYTYAYDSFDEKGNWTKRKVSGKQGLLSGEYQERNFIEYRKITYYP